MDNKQTVWLAPGPYLTDWHLSLCLPNKIHEIISTVEIKNPVYWETCLKWSWPIALKQPGRCRAHISLYFLSHGAPTEVSSPELHGSQKQQNALENGGRLFFFFSPNLILFRMLKNLISDNSGTIHVATAVVIGSGFKVHTFKLNHFN